jgi:hypothetical protein
MEDDDHQGNAGTVLQVLDHHVLGHGHGHYHPEPESTGWSIFRFGFDDFYDSALTAIAFLTFGIYTLQVFITLITNATAPKMGILVNNSTAAPPVRRSLDMFNLAIINATERKPKLFANSTTTKAPVTNEVMINNKKQKFRDEMHNFTTHIVSLVDSPTEGISLKPTFELVKVDEVIPNVELYPEPDPNQQERPPEKRVKYVSSEEVVAKFSLVTLRAVLKQDEPRCLHAALCRANRATLRLEGPPRLWLPMWRYVFLTLNFI